MEPQGRLVLYTGARNDSSPRYFASIMHCVLELLPRFTSSRLAPERHESILNAFGVCIWNERRENNFYALGGNQTTHLRFTS